ncbi:MAG: hypothetical protein WAU91_09740 [Desulfatitalea sp.]
MRRAWIITALVLLFLGTICACDNSPKLENATAREPATLQGSFYTESPDELIFPVKVLFALDCSGSMGAAGVGSDPDNLRLAAAREFIERYNGYPNISFEVMLWNQSVFRTTYVDGNPGFTKDSGDIEAVLGNVQNTGTTDYVGTIESIYRDIQRDITNTDNHDSLVRTKYVVVFFSDGLDNVPPVATEPRVHDIMNRMQELWDMVEDAGVGSFSFNTFLLPGIEMSQEDRGDCEDLLGGMAEIGHGRFETFQNAAAINFLNYVDLRMTAEYQVKFMVAYNFNVVPGTDTLLPDSDGDGLADQVELHPASPNWPPTDPTRADTDGDGLSDLFELRENNNDSNFDPTVHGGNCTQYLLPNGVYADTDYDGLNDCEEFLLTLNQFHPDTDADGIPDSVEYFTGTNPRYAQTTQDMDYDGSVDWIETQRHTNVGVNDPKVRERFSYAYRVADQGIEPQLTSEGTLTNVRRYDFNISNIAIMRTSGSYVSSQRSLANGDNVVRLFIAQVPEDMPDQPPVFRVADVLINASNGPRRIVLYPADFQLLE